MQKRLVPYRYNSYSDVLIAVGTAELVAALYGLPRTDVHLHATPAGFEIEHPEGEKTTDSVPLREIKYKESQELELSNSWDQIALDDDDDEPSWWPTVRAIRRLTYTGRPPIFNNRLARLYTSELGAQLLDGTADVDTRSMSALLYAQASKGVNKHSPYSTVTRQENIDGDAEQITALLGYQVGAAGFSANEHKFTLTIVPRPESITLQSYQNLVSRFLRGYFSRLSRLIYAATNGKAGQAVAPFFAMAYFDFITELFNYREDTPDMFGGAGEPVSNAISGLDRATYRKISRHVSVPFAVDSIAIPTWLDDKAVAVNVRDLIRELLSEHADPKMLYLPVRTFAESDPRPLMEFYRKYQPLKAPSGQSDDRTSKRLLHQRTLEYIMEETKYSDLNCDEMQRFAHVLRLRTLTKLHLKGEQPDYNLLTKLKSASHNERQLIEWMSSFIGEHNFRNERIRTKTDRNPGPNLSYDDLQVIIALIEKYDATFVANTLMAQSMSKRDRQAEPTPQESTAP